MSPRVPPASAGSSLLLLAVTLGVLALLIRTGARNRARRHGRRGPWLTPWLMTTAAGAWLWEHQLQGHPDLQNEPTETV